jgi:hypothetical protein
VHHQCAVGRTNHGYDFEFSLAAANDGPAMIASALVILFLILGLVVWLGYGFGKVRW